MLDTEMINQLCESNIQRLAKENQKQMENVVRLEKS